jgi:sulfite reductase alpha subunit-like flavoprotein
MADTQILRPIERRSVLILYGSETGNAQEVAEELGALTERLHFATHVFELNQCKPVCMALLQPLVLYFSFAHSLDL